MTGEPPPVSASIGPPQFPEYLRPIYANFATVNHTPWDFRITFGLVTAPAAPEEASGVEQTGEARPVAVADVIVPANLMFGLITALKQNFDNYIALHGAPGMNPEGPRQGPDEGDER